MIDAKFLRIRFDKIDGFIIVYDEIRYLVLFGKEKHDFIYSRIRYLIGVKNGITNDISHNYAKTKVDLYDFLPLEKTVTFHNVNNNYYYNIFLEKASYKLPKKIFFV